jgi:hypothetical protein
VGEPLKRNVGRAQKDTPMNFQSRLFGFFLFVSGSLFSIGCSSGSSDFETYMRVRLPSNVKILKMDGNWGNDPWRCWQISPADDELKRRLIATWKLLPNPNAFHGVATGGQIYCRYEGLTESYSGTSDSYRAVGINAKENTLVVYFYNG